MTPVYQTKHHPDGNCFAACIATLLDRKLEEVDIDISDCRHSVFDALNRFQEKADCVIHLIGKAATVTGGIVTTAERYCCVEVVSFMSVDGPRSKKSIWHTVVCEIGEGGKLSLVFDPGRLGNRLEDFPPDLGKLFIVKAN